MIAAGGACSIGAIRRFSDGWSVPLGVQMVIAVLQTVTRGAGHHCGGTEFASRRTGREAVTAAG